METAPSPSNPESRRWELLTVAVAAVLTGAGVVLRIVWVVSNKPASPSDARRVAAGDRTDSEPLPDSPPAPTWVGRKSEAWASDGSKTISFEGFDQLVGLVAATCGWRVDDSGSQEKSQQRSSRQPADFSSAQ